MPGDRQLALSAMGGHHIEHVTMTVLGCGTMGIAILSGILASLDDIQGPKPLQTPSASGTSTPREEVPTKARAIQERGNEITFNSSLLRELRAVKFVTKLIEEGRLDQEEYMRVYVHRIASEELTPLSSSSKLNGEWKFLRHLREIGHRSAKAWIDAHIDDLGHRDTIDVGAEIA